MSGDIRIDIAGEARRWLRIAQGEVGVEEMAGPRHNPRILEYFKATQFSFKEDETPWCAAFVCWCLESVGVNHPHHALASKFESYGVPVKEPFPGAICIIRRKGGSGRHVGFYMNETEKSIFILGGNQGDAVRVSAFAKDLLVGYRAPKYEDLFPILKH